MIVEDITNPDWHMGYPYCWTYRPKLITSGQDAKGTEVYSINIDYKKGKWSWKVDTKQQAFRSLAGGVENSSKQAIIAAKIALRDYFSAIMYSLSAVDFPASKEKSIREDRFKHLVVHYSKHSVDRYCDNENREKSFKDVLDYVEDMGELNLSSADFELLVKVKTQELMIAHRDQSNDTMESATQDVKDNRTELIELTEW